MSVCVVVGGQYGSEGKGKMTSYLALQDDAGVVIRCGGPNAGHTVDYQGSRHVLRQVPSGFVNPRSRLLIAAGAVIDLPILLHEVEELGVAARLGIDPNAAVLSDEDRQTECDLQLRKRIASTLSGTGATTSRKVLRDERLRLAKDVSDLRRWLCPVSSEANAAHDRGELVLVEGTQGFGLSLHHGDQYPYRTSRDTTAANFLAEVGLSPLTVKDIVLVIRTYPIRVAGKSGPFGYKELSWQDVQNASGYPHPIGEYTSVTQKLRRVAQFDMDLVRRAVQVNRPTYLAVHGLDYLDYRNFGKSRFAELTETARAFLAELESNLGVPVAFVFTGPPNENLIDRRCSVVSAKQPEYATTH